MILDGKLLANTLQERMRELLFATASSPFIAILQVGEDPSSTLYIENKKKACAKVGIRAEQLKFPLSITQQELLTAIHGCNENPTIDGILLQLPLPPHLHIPTILSTIDPTKDLDGLHPTNLGKLLLEDPSGFIPCTPQAIVALLQSCDLPIKRKEVVIIGRSAIVGKPLALLMAQKGGLDATVTLAHGSTPRLSELTQRADILVAACGKPHIVEEKWVKEGAILIDVGISRIKDPTSRTGYRFVGDIHPQARSRALAFTEVPGGVGPMTVTMLLANAIKAYQNSHNSASKLI